MRIAAAAFAAGVVLAIAATAPARAQGQAIMHIVSAAAESSHVLCTGHCFLTSVYVTAGATAGYLLAFNATSAPADGAVTPDGCVAVAAGQTVALDYGNTSDVFPTGLTLVFSTTGCFTKTASATAYFAARKQ